MADTFLTAVCTSLTGPESIRIESQPVRPLSAGEVRIAVRAAGLNFPDLLMTYGKYQHRPEPPFTPGMEICGDVIETAPDVTNLAIGDRVISGGKTGGFAEQFIASSGHVRALPLALDYAEGASWRAGATTAWHALHDKAALQSGETVLVLGASGGVGMAAVKLAKHLGALVIGTGSTPEKRAAIRHAGADHVLAPDDPDLPTKVKALTGERGADVVFDPVGGEISRIATRCIGWGGRFLIVGFASGSIPSFPANHALIKGYSLMGLRAGEASRRDPALSARTETALAQLAEQGTMRPHISHRFPLAQTAEALCTLEQRAVIGRAVILV